MEAAKFTDSGEFSDFVQTVWEKVIKEILHSAKRPRNEFSPRVLLNVGSGSQEMTTGDNSGDKVKLVILFIPLLYSLPNQQDCALQVVTYQDRNCPTPTP